MKTGTVRGGKTSLVTDASGGIYISGTTYGDLFGPSAGNSDAFLVKLVPEPSTFILAVLGLLGLALYGRRMLPAQGRPATTGRSNQRQIARKKRETVPGTLTRPHE